MNGFIRVVVLAAAVLGGGRVEALTLATGAPGGAFYDYGPALVKAAEAAKAPTLTVRETGGSNENIAMLAAGTVDLGLVNMGPAFDAWSGTGAFAGREIKNLRAVLPMYETPFHVAVLKASGIARLSDLGGRKVGVGPARGPGEVFFRGLMEATGLAPTVFTGNPTAQAASVLSGELDAFWYGAGLPVPAFRDIADKADTLVFGFTAEERAAFMRRFPYFAASTIPARTYRGQDQPIASVGVWNFVLARPETPAADITALVEAWLDGNAIMTATLSAAAASRAENVVANSFLPFHPAATAVYRRRGVAIPAGLGGD